MLSLPEKVQVLPAHTNKPADFNEELISTTIGEAKRRIPFLQSGEEDFIQTLLQKIPPTPTGYLAIVEKNLAGNFADINPRSEEHTYELQSLMRISNAVFCLNKNTNTHHQS